MHRVSLKGADAHHLPADVCGSARAAGGKWLRNLVNLQDVVLNHPRGIEGWDTEDARMGYVSDIASLR